MGTMVSLSIVQVGVLAFLACLSGGIYIGLRGPSSLGWLSVAACCGAIAALLVGQAHGSLPEWLALTLISPVVFLCLAQSVRTVLGQQHQYPILIWAVVSLTAIAAIMAIAGFSFQYQTLPLQLACAIPAFECVVRLMQARQRSLLDMFLVVTIFALAGTFLVRIPVYLILFAPGSGYSVIRVSTFQHVSLALSGALGPAIALLLIVKIVGNVIATYRTRSELDGLTGLLNRHAFDLAVGRISRTGGAVILCDIDHFKGVNDRYGHAVGDDVLCAFAGLLATTGHCAGRVGGEEFALLLRNGSIADAANLAEMIRLRFQRGTYPGIALDHKLSASFGVARLKPGVHPKEAFIRADAALYRAKGSGRDRVVVAPDDPQIAVDTRLAAA